jgi:simple sugar transport system permease protein
MKFKFNLKYLSLTITIALFMLMYGLGAYFFDGFLNPQVFLNLFIDNAFLCVTAVGMTFVIISGGIDLSVGSVIALSTMISAHLVEQSHWSPGAVIPLVLAVGSLLGFVHGYMIHKFKLPPFIVTLAGMFLARGLCYVISINSITINNEFYTSVAQYHIPMGGRNFISINVIIFFVVVAAAIFVAHYTRFGRTIYAIGGNEQSAVLMGLPVGRTKVLVYTINGFCSALAGVVFTFYMLSGYGLHAVGMEMDAIASVVVGGTLLTGGVGYVLGTMFGVLILGTIQTLIVFQGTLSSWWTKIVIGALLFLFCLLQRVFESGKGRKPVTAGAQPAAAPAPAKSSSALVS